MIYEYWVCEIDTKTTLEIVCQCFRMRSKGQCNSIKLRILGLISILQIMWGGSREWIQSVGPLVGLENHHTILVKKWNLMWWCTCSLHIIATCCLMNFKHAAQYARGFIILSLSLLLSNLTAKQRSEERYHFPKQLAPSITTATNNRKDNKIVLDDRALFFHGHGYEFQPSTSVCR